MTFFRPGALYLFILLPIVLLLLLRNMLRGKTVDYPAVMMFRKTARENSRFLRILSELLKVFLILLALSCTIMYFASPHIPSGKYDKLIVCIDCTPLSPVNKSMADSIVNEMKQKYEFRNTVYLLNGKKTKTLNSKTVFRKDPVSINDFIESGMNERISTGTLSARILYITDRYIDEFEGADLIHIGNSRRIALLRASQQLEIYSYADTVIDLRLYLKDMLVFRKQVPLTQGLNYPPVQDIEYDSIECGDTISLNSVHQLKLRSVNLKTDNFYIRKAMNALSAEICEDGIIISEYPSSGQSIVITDVPGSFTKKNGRVLSEDRYLSAVLSRGPELEFSALSEIPGKPLVFTDSGQRLISMHESSYYIAVPMDTAYSNLVLLPQFIPLMDELMRRIEGSRKLEPDSIPLSYRQSILKNCSNYMLSDYPKMMNLKYYFLIGAVLCVLLLALLVLL